MSGAGHDNVRGDGRRDAGEDEHADKDGKGGCMRILNFLKKQWIIIGFALACLMGYLFPGENLRLFFSHVEWRTDRRGQMLPLVEGISAPSTVLYMALWHSSSLSADCSSRRPSCGLM